MQTTMLNPPAVHKVGRVRAALLQWLGVPIQLTDAAFWGAYAGGGAESSSGQTVNATSALKLSTFWRCVRLISETLGSMPFKVHYHDTKKGVAYTHPLYSIIHTQPNADMTACTFWEVMAVALLLRGNTYAQIVTTKPLNLGGIVIALVFIHPDRMVVQRRKDGSLEYRWADEFGKQHNEDESAILHIPAFSLDGIVGLTPLTYGAEVFGSAMAASTAAGSVFKHGLITQGTFETDSLVPEKHRSLFQERIKAYQGAVRAGLAPLLEGGIHWKSIGINPDDAQLLESRSFSVEEICRWFGVPPAMVGHTTNSTSWGTGLEQQKLWFLAFGLQIWMTRIQQQCNRKLLSTNDKREVFTEFSSEALLRTDATTRAAFYSTMTQNGNMTRDEVRAKENLPAMGGNAEVLTVQSALVPLDDLGSAGAPPPDLAARNALRAWLGVTDASTMRPDTATQPE